MLKIFLKIIVISYIILGMKQNKLLDFLMKIVKGGFIGVAAVIPGFSGGTIACIVGIYDELIEAISGIRKHFKESILTLLPYLLGAAIFAALLITPITWGVDKHPFITVSLFTGLMLGGLPSFCNTIKGKASKTNILALLLGAIAVVAIIIPSLSSGGAYNESLMTPSWYTYLILFLIGILGSFALVVPGISGSMILLILGFYNPIMDTIKGFLHSIGINIGDFSTAFNPSILENDYYLFQSFGLLACFGIGIIVGFFVISKIMKYLLTNHKIITYFAILGFILASIIGIYANPTYYESLNHIDIILAIIFLVVGCVGSYFLTKLADNKSKEGIE